MSEQDEQRPLTRRERRMRELEETGAMDLSEATGDDSAAPVASPAQPATEADIEISPFHEDGTPRSRREMRQLREEALAALHGSHAGAPESEPEQEPEAPSAPASDSAVPTAETAEPAAEPETIVAEPISEDRSSAAAEEPAIVAEPIDDAADPEAPEGSAAEAEFPAPVPAVRPDADAAEDEAPAPEPDFDTLMSPPTEPFTVEELREAEASGDDDATGFTESAVADADEVPEAGADAPVEEEAPAKAKRRFPWQRSKAAADSPDGADNAADAVVEDDAQEAGAAEGTPAEPATTVLEAQAPGSTTADAAETTVLDAQATPVVPTVPSPDAPEDLPTAAPETVALPVHDEAPSAHDPEAPAAPGADTHSGAASPDQRTSYSFPDIAPPEEWRSVFDDPAGRQFPTPGQGGSDGDFDDLISRAVAQEGSTGGTGASALILPTMPEDTGGLTGPLGATGDLYVTGSLKLPKSLGETGGHSALHDSIEMDPITGDQIPETHSSGEGPAPVSARHAVSARVDSGMPVVAKPAREKSKLPLILSLTGGGLLVVVVGLGAWGASNGFFG